MSSQANQRDAAAERPASRPLPGYFTQLRILLSGQGFRRLFAIRVISRTADGVFQAGLGTYVFFNATTFPNPSKAAIAFSVLYLPYSLIGPFVGVFIDRWSRRQILAWCGLIRAIAVAITGLLILGGALGMPVYISALVASGIARFYMSALSAATPHVVEDEELVMANAVAPPIGTLMAFAGGLAGIEVHLVTGGGTLGSAVTIFASGLCYLIAGLVATLMGKASLGPDRVEAERSPGTIVAELSHVAAGLAEGARHAWARRRARGAFFTTSAQQILFGIMLLMSILLFRNYFFGHAKANVALAHYLRLVLLTGIGYGMGALITPAATRRLTKSAWITSLLVVAGVVTGVFGATFTQVGFMILAFCIGIVAQGTGICVTTILQQELHDDYLGRAFSVNDVAYNVSFVFGVLLCALIIPPNGKSLLLLLIDAAGYLVAAAAFRAISGPPAAVTSAAKGASPHPA